MDADEFRDILARWSLTQTGCATFLDVDERTVRRWATGEKDVPRSVALLFRIMRREGLTPETAEFD